MPAELSKAPPPPPRILTVDDDPGQRSLLDSFLRSQNFETVLAKPLLRSADELYQYNEFMTAKYTKRD